LQDFDTVLNNEEYQKIIGEKECATLAKDKARVQKRMRSNTIKADGDREFYNEKMNAAFKKYEEAVVEDSENEYAYANMGVIALKNVEYLESIDITTKAIDIINNF